jgi:cell division septation protein DedD
LVPRWLLVVGVLSFIALFAGLSFGVYTHVTAQKPTTAPVLLADVSADSATGAGVPLLKAPQTPLKVRPSDPGGMEVPDQDKMVLGVAAGDVMPSSAGPVLAPGAEEPLPRPKQQAVPKAQTLLQAPKQAPQQAPQQAMAKSAPNPSNEVQNEAQKPIAPAAKKSATIVLQLGSFGSVARAQAGWAELQAAHSILQGFAVDIQEAGTNKIRLRATGFRSRAQAQEVCNSLKEKGQACFIP